MGYLGHLGGLEIVGYRCYGLVKAGGGGFEGSTRAAWRVRGLDGLRG